MLTELVVPIKMLDLIEVSGQDVLSHTNSFDPLPDDTDAVPAHFL